MPATNAWDETKPAGSDLASTIDNQTRQLKLDIRERLALQHYWNASVSTDGIHKEISITPATTDVELIKTNSNQSVTGANTTSAINLGVTWNTSGSPTAILLNVTNTLSGASANLLDLQVASVSKFKVDKAGNITFAGSITMGTQTANTHFVGPTSGGAAAPTFRALVAADIPSILTLSAAQFTSLSAANLTAVPAAQLSGTITSATQDLITRTGTVTSGTWSGLFGVVTGANLTSLTAGNLSGTITSSVQDNITRTGTIVSGVWNGTKVGLLYGGTNVDLSATGGASQFLRQNSAGANITVIRPAVADLSDASNVALLNVANQFTALGDHNITASGNSTHSLTLRNTTAGTAAIASLRVGNDAGNTTVLECYSSTFTTTTHKIANGASLYVTQGGGLTLAATNAGGAITFYTGGTNLRWGFNSAGDFTFGSSNHIADSSGVPTYSSSVGGSGTPSVAGNDYAFIVTRATGQTAIIINFGHTFNSAPVVTVTPYNTAAWTAGVPIRDVTTTYVEIGDRTSTLPEKMHVHVRGN